MSNGGALEGVRVVDVSAAVAGPYISTQLADMGADVIMVEPVHRPDVMRVTGPVAESVSGSWVAMHRNKRAIAVDLRDPRGLDAVRSLADRADVFVQNFRPGVADRLGVGPATLTARNERLVYVSVSGFGPDGPYADQPVYDPIVQGLAGIAASQGGDMVKNVLVDKVTAMTAANAALGALLARGRTGRGQHVEVSLLDAALSFVWLDAYWNHAMPEAEPVPTYTSWYTPYDCTDGQVALAWPTDDKFRRAMEGLERPELADDPRFATRAGRVLNAAALLAECRDTFGRLTTADALARLREADVPSAPVKTLDEALVDPQVVHNRLVEDHLHPVAGPVRITRPPARFSDTPSVIHRHAPAFGEHTDEVLAELGLDDGAIAAMRADGVIA